MMIALLMQLPLLIRRGHLADTLHLRTDHCFFAPRLDDRPLDKLLRRDLFACDARQQMRHAERQQVDQDVQVEAHDLITALVSLDQALFKLIYPLLERFLKVSAAADDLRLPIDDTPAALPGSGCFRCIHARAWPPTG